MEALGDAYLRALAAMAGVTCNRLERDFGMDYCLRDIEERGGRFRDGSRLFDVELKCTTQATIDETWVTYDLEAGAYNDLCQAGGNCERFLVLLVLPTQERDWLTQTREELILRRCTFWTSLAGQVPTESTSTTRIRIPVENVFSVETIGRLMRREAGGPIS
jgi:hypothetical protein